VWMMDVHATGGRAMMVAARKAVDETSAKLGVPRPLLVAVTVLTSLDDADLREQGCAASTGEQAVRLARLAQACGLDGVVCSAVEAPAIRAALGAEFALVTPGIRPLGTARDDQARIITPEAAMKMGADYLVVGRPVTRADDPVEALGNINASIGVME
jgi:orotidine-5'-phosphate decarboxylase